MIGTATLPSRAPAATDDGTLADRLSTHHNAFGLLRLVFAGCVIVSHAFPIGGFGDDPVLRWTRNQLDLGDIGLLGFFAISGYLIAYSAQHNGTYSYLWRRFLRIYPGFLTVLLVSAVVIGPLFYWLSHDTIVGYWTNGPGGPLNYVVTNAQILIQQYGIHDLFTTDSGGRPTETSVMNGSLWTLWFESMCYLFIALVALLGGLHRRRWITAAAASLAFVLSSPLVRLPILPDALSGLLTRQAGGIQLAATFLVGATIQVYGRYLRLHTSWALISAAVVAITLVTTTFIMLGYVFFVYLVLWLAVRLPQRTYWIGQRTDISYGLYIYGWPIQAGLFALGAAAWGYLPYLAITALVLIPIAWLSWTLVEHPAQRLRNYRLPGSPAAAPLATPSERWRYYLPRVGTLLVVAALLLQ